MKHFILFTILMIFIGCGSTPNNTDKIETPFTPEKQQPPKSAKNIFTIGDDQNVLEGNSIILNASILDKNIEFVKFTWKEEDTTLSSSDEFNSETLSIGKHYISLEMVDTDGNIYEDTVVVTVKEELVSNIPPVAKNLNFILNEDEQFLGELSGNDKDGDDLNYLFVSFPKHGKLSGSSANLRYMPDTNYHGSDSFIYKTNDGTIDSQYATVTITIVPVNDAPIAIAQSITLAENSFRNIILTASDIEGDNLTTSVISQPSHGELNGSTYTPNLNYFGSDSFTFISNDGEEDSAPATINIMITSVNDAPIGVRDEANTTEDTSITINVLSNDNDIENEPIMIGAITQPLNGSVVIVNNDIRYTPNDNFFGIDTFTYQPRDNIENGSPTTVTVVVTSINDLPLASSQNITLDEDTNKTIVLMGTDIDNDLLTYTVTTQPIHGELNGSIYTPNLNYFGSDSFTFMANDGSEDSAPAIINIMITSVNDVPIFNPLDSIIIDEDSTLFNGTLFAIDKDNDTVIFSTIDSLDGFALDPNGTYTFNPSHTSYQVLKEGESKEFIVSISASDSDLNSSQNLIIFIRGINDTPIALEDFNHTTEDDNITFNILENDIDIDHNATLMLIDINTTEGNITFEQNGSITFSPIGNFDYLSQDEEHNISLTYTIQDEYNATAFADITITITGIDDLPIIDSIVSEDSNLSITNGTITGTILVHDPDGTVTFYDENSTNGFDINYTTGVYTFTPPENLYSYLTSGESTTLTIPIMIGVIEENITITIIGKNDAPILNLITPITISEDDSTIDGITLAIDPDDDNLSFSATFASGLSFNNNGSYTFDPINYQNLSEGEQETITISIIVSDGELEDEENLTITITGVNDLPVAVAGEDITVDEGEPVTFDSEGSYDEEDTSLLYEWKESSTVFSNDENFTKSDFTIGTHIVTLKVTDSTGLTATDTVTVIVNSAVVSFTKHIIQSGFNSLEGNYVSDINKDGFIDILTADSGGGLNGWFENEQNGSFSSHNVISDSSNNTESVLSIDLDNDGYMDVLSGFDTNNIVWYKNSGTEDFNSTFTIQTSASTNYIYAIDLDEDGDIDILYGSWEGGIYWCENDGSENFTEYQIATENKVGTVIPADFDNDGDLDIVAALYGDGNVAWYENDGSENFTKYTLKNDANVPKVYSVSVSDLNQDGYQDIIAGPDNNGNIYWFNNDNKTFIEHVLVNTSTDYGTSTTADFDDDGYIDILYSVYDSGELGWYKNDGFGNFTKKVIEQTGSNPLDPYIADLDNDGDIDFAVALSGSGEYVWYENNLYSGNDSQPLPKTGQTISYATGDDGDLQKGTDHNYTRDDDNDIVIDNTTGLMWIDDIDSATTKLEYEEAQVFCQDKTTNGFSDWRAPEIHELYYIVDRSNIPMIAEGFNNTSDDSDGYWTSNHHVSSRSLYVGFDDGYSQYEFIIDLLGISPTKHIRCVRGDTFILTLDRNETTEIVNDNKHRLQWQDTIATQDDKMDWSSAMTYCQDLELNGQEWRLPNINELHSLASPFIFHSAFESSTTNKYWSSTGSETSDSRAVDFEIGHDNKKDIANEFNVRCVRDYLFN